MLAVYGIIIFSKTLFPSTLINPSLMNSSAYLLEHSDFWLIHLESLMDSDWEVNYVMEVENEEREENEGKTRFMRW